MSPLPPFRQIAVVLLAVGVLLRQAQPFLWEAYGPERLDYLLALVVGFLLPLSAALVLPYAVYGWFARRHRRRPASFLVRDGGFDAPVSALSGRRIIMFGMLAFAVPVTESGAHGRQPLTDDLMLPLGVVLLLAGGTMVADALRPGPVLRLTPDHLVLGGWRRRQVRWDTIARSDMPPPAPGDTTFHVREVQPGRVRWHNLPVDLSHVDTAFLISAVHHYTFHPEHRAAIGTEAELHRLRASLGDVSSAGPAVSGPSDAFPSPEPGRSNA
ncbi:hypothetical protein [Catellatospora sichuanensis]|uniref:hypothetical protein n=1 Tax=Catellatospora sichuanensis TaxID=1969805 RepID=UPI00118200ED|nr:hypothetical protein [Catellatospora sichuanensis]